MEKARPRGEEGKRCRYYGDSNASCAIKSSEIIDSINSLGDMIPAKNSEVLFSEVDS